MDLGLKGRRALITGGSQGIGYAVAEGFLEEGCSVVIASKNEERLQSAVERLSKYGETGSAEKPLTCRFPAPRLRWPMPIAIRIFSSTTRVRFRQGIFLKLMKHAGAQRGTSRCSGTSI